MRRIFKAIGTLAVVALAACSDRGSVAPDAENLPRRTLTPIPCENIDYGAVVGLINTVFGAGSPNANAALGKWDNIQKQNAARNFPTVVAKTWDLVEYILAKQKDGKLPADGDSELLGRSLFCFANINATLPQSRDAWVVYPTDIERTLVTENGYAGLKLAGRNVQETSLISIVPAVAALRTNLDKYPTVYEFSKYPSNVFVEPVTAAVCGAIPSAVPDDVLARMVLGHNKGTSDFELLPKVSVDFLNCAPLALGSAARSFGEKLLGLLLPANLYALGPGASGIGGTLSEFSPIGPVDPQIKVTQNEAGNSAPIGSLVLTPPSVTLSTEKGTLLSGISVAYAATSGGGSIAPGSVLTNVSGVAASTTWRLGTTVGTNTATATPVIGTGDAVLGVIFSPAVITFTAQATAPTGIEITGGPVTGTSYTAGVLLPSAAIRIVGESNRTVEGFTGAITVSALQGGPLFGAATPFPTLAGLGTITGLSIRQAGAANQLQFAAGSLTASTGVFLIGAASASSLVINAGDNQTARFGTVLGSATGTIAPSVLVRDEFGNAVSGATVYFTPTTSSTVTQATNGSGIAATTWTLQAGPNQLLASLNAAPTTDEARFKLFNATGTTTSTQILSCLPGNQKDPIASYAVRVDGQTGRITDAAFYLSITGSANTLTPYEMVVTASRYKRVGNVDVLDSTFISKRSMVFLRGSASEQKEANFSFPSGFTSGNGTKIVFTIAPAPSQAAFSGTINFNAGTCAPGSTRCASVTTACKAVNEVLINTPLGAVFRQSPAVKLLGF